MTPRFKQKGWFYKLNINILTEASLVLKYFGKYRQMESQISHIFDFDV